MEEIARKTADAIQRRVGSSQAERVYRELQADPAISGVTVTRGVESGVTPSSIVPKTEFVARSGSLRQEIENASKRTRDELATLELISPVLALDTKRQWRFRGASGDFGAEMNDERFLVDLVQGKTAVTMSSGIFLDVELRTVEEKKAGVWQVKSRSILQVRQIRLPPSQISLSLPR